MKPEGENERENERKRERERKSLLIPLFHQHIPVASASSELVHLAK